MKVIIEDDIEFIETTSLQYYRNKHSKFDPEKNVLPYYAHRGSSFRIFEAVIDWTT